MSPRAPTAPQPRPLPFVVEQFHTDEKYWFTVATALCHFDVVPVVMNRRTNVRVLYHGRVAWDSAVHGVATEAAVETTLLAAEREFFQRVLSGARVSA